MDRNEFQELVLKRLDLLDLVASQVSKLTQQVGTLTSKVDGLTSQVDSLTRRVDSLTRRVDSLTRRVDSLTRRVDSLTRDMAEVKADLQFTKETVVRIENEHGQKLGALLNGYKLHEERLDRHEAIISKKF